MHKIVEVAKSRAKNAQHVQFATDVKGAVSQETADELGFGAQRAAFGEAGDQEINYFQPEKAYLETPEVAGADSGRDNDFLFYREILKAFVNYCTNPELQQAAATVYYLFNEVKDANRLDYPSETSTLTQLTVKMRQEPYLSALETLQMENAADVIDASNQKFNTIYLKRSAENRDRALSVSMKTLRQNTDAAYDEMVEAINALFIVNELVTKDESKREALQKIIDDINAIVVRLRMNIGGSSAIEEGKTPTEPTEPTNPEDPNTGKGEEGGSETTDPSEGEEEEGTGAIPHP